MRCEDPGPIFLRLAAPHSGRALPQISLNSFDSHRFYVCICFVLIYICETPRGASIQTGKHLARLSASGLTIMETMQPKSGRPRKAAPT